MSEEFPRYVAPNAATTTVKVSLDEWAVVNRQAGVELMTDGLSGCVAVGIRSQDKLGLTHVYSGAVEDFDGYKAALSEFVAKVGAKDQISEVHIMHNGNKPRSGDEMSLPQMIERHLLDHGLADPKAIHVHVDNGCVLASNEFYLKSRDDQAHYIRGYTNTEFGNFPEEQRQSAKTSVSLVSGGFPPLGRYKPLEGYVGASDVEDVAWARTPGHFAHARYAPTLPHASVASSSMDHSSADTPSSRKVSADDPIYKEILGTFREQKLFGLQKVQIAHQVAQAVVDSGATGIDNIKVNKAADYLTVSTRERGDLNFEIDKNRVKLVPSDSVSAPSLPSSSSPFSSSSSWTPPHPHGHVAPPLLPPSSQYLGSSHSPMPSSSSSFVAPQAEPSAPKPHSSSSALDKPLSLYEQTVEALQPHLAALKLSTSDQIAKAANEIASQALHSGLSSIERLETLAATDSRGAALITRQDSASPRQSDPIEIAALQQRVGVADAPPQERSVAHEKTI